MINKYYLVLKMLSDFLLVPQNNQTNSRGSLEAEKRKLTRGRSLSLLPWSGMFYSLVITTMSLMLGRKSSNLVLATPLWPCLPVCPWFTLALWEQRTCFIYLFSFLGPHLWHMKFPQPQGLNEATAASLCHSNSNARSESCLWRVPQLTATLDP